MDEIIFLSDVLLASIALIWLFVAAVQDVKKREVANWLNFSLIIIALAVRAFAALISYKPISIEILRNIFLQVRGVMTNPPFNFALKNIMFQIIFIIKQVNFILISSHLYYFFYGIAALAIFFVIANIFYYARIFAGGDAKLLIALATVFATTPVFAFKNQLDYITMFANLPFMLVFLINVLFMGAVYGLGWSIVLASMHFKPFKEEFRKLNRKMKVTRILCLTAFIVLVLTSVITKENLLFVLSIMFLFFPYLLIFVKAVENACMVKAVSVKELTEGDWLFKPLKIKKNVIMPKWEGLTIKEIALIKKSKIRKVIIKQGIPFTPVFLIALIISFFTNLLVFFIRFFI